ncbi:hypothetical protein [Amycolatopsis acidicola]|nr:hypothetical protein [Amycolatopsis acidicola]
MGKHRFDENEEDRKWGGPALAERKEAEPRRHSREEKESESDRADAERQR